MQLKRTVAPVKAPVDLEDLKRHAIAEWGDDDRILQAFLDAAINHLDGYEGVLGRCMISQTWLLSLPTWPDRIIRLPFPDVTSVVIVYSDSLGAEQTLATSKYEVLEDEQGGYIRYRSAFSGPIVDSDRFDAIRITFVAGYGTEPGNVPDDIRQAICLLATHNFAHRGDEMKSRYPDEFRDLIAPVQMVDL